MATNPIIDSLPTAVVGTPGSTITLAEMLQNSFGTTSPRGFSEYQLSTLNTNQPIGMWGDTETSYWGIGRNALDSYWLLDGHKLTATTTVSSADIDRVTMFIGNSMMNTTAFSVPVTAPNDPSPTYRTYNVWTTQPAVKSPNFSSGQIDADDIVASAALFNRTYTHIPNDNNCNWIADNVAAAAGAVMPYLNYSNDPSDNVEGGFWRIAYRGTDTSNPVSNWSTLTQPGDIVRMVWAEKPGDTRKPGHHTTTVTGEIDSDGRLPVYDNDDLLNNPNHYIREHTAAYWNGTNPANVTIYRIDPNHQYLISGGAQGETLQGTVYDDLIRLGGGSDTVFGEGGNDSILGNAGDDFVDGGTGADTIYGAGGRDTLLGGDGNDQLFGEDGDDILIGGTGADFMSGGGGNDRLSGGGDADTLMGGLGNDELGGDAGNDILVGNEGADTLFGGLGNDQINGGSQDDVLLGDEGNDEIGGGTGNDILSGGADADTLWGEEGSDTLDGGTGNDILIGGAGADQYNFGTNSGADIINGFSAVEGDRLALFGQSYVMGQDQYGNAVLNLSGGGSVTLSGVAPGQVNPSFFA